MNKIHFVVALFVYILSEMINNFDVLSQERKTNIYLQCMHVIY